MEGGTEELEWSRQGRHWATKEKTEDSVKDSHCTSQSSSHSTIMTRFVVALLIYTKCQYLRNFSHNQAEIISV